MIIKTKNLLSINVNVLMEPNGKQPLDDERDYTPMSIPVSMIIGVSSPPHGGSLITIRNGGTLWVDESETQINAALNAACSTFSADEDGNLTRI
jgi:hypothetical protein